MEKGVLRAGGWSKSEVNRADFTEDKSHSRTQDSVMRHEVSGLLIKTGSSVESLGEFENKQNIDASVLAPTPRISE